MTTQHTPGPWKVSETPEPGSAWTITSPSGHIAIGWGPGSSQDDANAEFIVRACNSHDALLAACQEVSKTGQVQEDKDGECTGVLITHEAWTWCLEAVALATGNQIDKPQVSGNLNRPLERQGNFVRMIASSVKVSESEHPEITSHLPEVIDGWIDHAREITK